MSPPLPNPPLSAERALAEYRASLAYYNWRLDQGKSPIRELAIHRAHVEALVTRLTVDPAGWEREEMEIAEAWTFAPHPDKLGELVALYGYCAAMHFHVACRYRDRKARLLASGQLNPVLERQLDKLAAVREALAASARLREADRQGGVGATTAERALHAMLRFLAWKQTVSARGPGSHGDGCE